MTHKNIYKDSERHKKSLQETLERYKKKSLRDLHIAKDIYGTVRKEAIKAKDSRWKIPQEEGKLSIKEHLELIQQAIDSKKSIVIKCKPAIIGAKQPRR